MIRSLKPLRSVALADLPLYEMERSLRCAGRQVALCTNVPPHGYAAFEAIWEGGVHEGWVNLGDLMRHRYPALEGSAWRALDQRYAIGLFGEEGSVDAIPAPPGGWERIRLGRVVECDLPAEPLLSFEEPGCAHTLFRRFPVALPVSTAATRFGDLTLIMRFVIGTACVPLALVPRIAPGDALLIRARRFEVRVGAKRLCGFQCKGTDIMLNDWNHDGEAHASDPKPIVDNDIVGVRPEPFDVSSLPVTLEFALREEPMTVAEVAGLHAGSVIPLRGPVGEVTVRVNGRAFGVGELIQVGERLAVEITAIWLEKQGVCNGE